MPVQQNLTAWRNVGWAPALAFAYVGDPLPLVGASIAMQVRQYGGQAGAPLLAIGGIPFEDDDVSALSGVDGQRMLLLAPTVPAAQLATLPGLNQPEAGNAQMFVYDIVITYEDGLTELLAAGTFTVLPGVTVS